MDEFILKALDVLGIHGLDTSQPCEIMPQVKQLFPQWHGDGSIMIQDDPRDPDAGIVFFNITVPAEGGRTITFKGSMDITVKGTH